MKVGDEVLVKGKVIHPDDDEYPGCLHVEFGYSGDLYLDPGTKVMPATAVPDAELRAAFARTNERYRRLIPRGVRLIQAEDDLARTDAWLAQQEGGDER